MNRKTLIVLALIVAIVTVSLIIIFTKNENTKKNVVEIAEVTNYYPLEDICIYHDDATISLPTNRAKGYCWKYEIKDKTIAVVTSEEYKADESASEGIKDKIGADGYTTFKVELIKKGETQIIFSYLEEQNGETSVIENVVFDISVNDNFQIAIVKEERF